MWSRAVSELSKWLSIRTLHVRVYLLCMHIIVSLSEGVVEH